MTERLIWVASYPKSGNTWLRMFVESVMRGGASIDINDGVERAPSAASRAVFDALLDVDSSDLLVSEIERARPEFYRLWAASLAKPQALKVHDAWSASADGEPLFPPELTLATFYVVRDPRDVALSLAHQFGSSLDEAIAGMANPDMFTGQPSDHRFERQLPQKLTSWSNHVTSWLGSGLAINLLRYEDMIATGEKTFTRVARKLDRSICGDAIARAIEATRFDLLQVQERKGGFVETVANREGFFRLGRSGGWRTELNAAQARHIERDHGAVMERLGYL